MPISSAPPLNISRPPRKRRRDAPGAPCARVKRTKKPTEGVPLASSPRLPDALASPWDPTPLCALGRPTQPPESAASEVEPSGASLFSSLAASGPMLRSLQASGSEFLVSLGLRRPAPSAEEADELRRERAQEMRGFAHDLVEACAVPTPDAQAHQVRAAIARHPEMFRWLIQGQDLTEIMADADLPALPPTMHSALTGIREVGSGIQRTLSKVREARALMRDLDALRSFYASLSDRCLLAAVTEVLPSMIAKRAMATGREVLIDVAVEFVQEQVNARIRGLSDDERLALLEYVPEHVFAYIATQVNQGITSAKFSEAEAISILLDERTGFDLSQVPPVFAEFFELALTEYFDRLPVEDKRRICLAMLELPPHADPLEKLATILNASGPTIQKLMQLLGNEVKSERVASVMRALKANIKAFPNEQAVQIIERDLGRPMAEIFSEFDETPLAAASVGQVYAARLRDTNAEVIVKVMRPNLPERAAREIALFKSLAKSPGVRKVVAKLEESLLEELDFRTEAANLEEGAVYFRPRKGLVPISTVPEATATPHVLMMTRAQGKPINKVPPEQLPMKLEALEALLEVWFEEAFFESGFFHGDLHAGNIFFSPEPIFEVSLQGGDSITNPFVGPELYVGPSVTGRDFTTTLIDFGSSGRLSEEQRRALISLTIALERGRVGPAMHALGKLCTMAPATQAKLTQVIEGSLAAGRGGGATLDTLINKAIELDADLPKSLVQFNRGRAFLENQILETNKALDAAGDTTTRRVDPQDVYYEVVRWRVMTGREFGVLKTLLFG